ncbi:NAD(P)/FAD-dependent oxidoreductase, partial [Streptomyces albiaxialis]
MSARHVVVVGAGPGGLAAADGALAAGARVTLVDAEERPGGQYHRRPPGDPGPAVFARRRARVLGHPRCVWLGETAVWALERRDEGGRPPLVHVLRGPADGADRARSVLDADALVLAPGAYDRVLPFPGWELPGVVTAGAAQALAKGEGVAVGARALVAGAGPFLLPVAASLLAAGARVREVCEANAPATLARGWSARPWELGATGGKAAELARCAALLARHRVPVRAGRTVVEARGEGRVEEAVTAALRPDWSVVPGSERTLAVDAVCVGHGFTPQLELPLAAGCALRHGFVAVDADQRAGAPGVYAAGEVTGIAGAPAARAEGALAG